MVLEVAILNVKPNESDRFEQAFVKAELIISSMKGCIEHDLMKCVEKENQYVLLVKWNTLEDHEIGFRQSKEYQEWKALLHHFYEPFPEVQHYTKVY
ncbi:antibiotic biosynthesis monooxygenase family protein [Reichenbachiella sp.]